MTLHTGKMDELTPCLVVDRQTGQWRIENRPPVPPRIPPNYNWSQELEKACKIYRSQTS